MRADLSQLEHPLIASPPPPSQWPHSVVDRQHVCTLCWVEPNKEIILVLGTECYLMFVCNGMLCTLQNYKDSSDRGATSALLPHLWERFWIPQRDAIEMHGNGKASKVQTSIGQYVVRQHAGTLGGMHTSENVSVTCKESSERQGEKKSTRDQRGMEQRGPSRHCTNCVRKTRWGR